MISQVENNESITVISPNGINFPQTDKPQPTHQRQDSLKKHLKAEIKVMAAMQIMCAVTVLGLGIIFAFVPPAPHFASVISVLLKSGYPFVGALFVSRLLSGTRWGRQRREFSSCCISVYCEKVYCLWNFVHCYREKVNETFDGSLTLNILSVSFAFVGIFIIFVSLAGLHPASEQCMQSKELRSTDYHYYHPFYDSNRNECSVIKSVLAGVLSVMLISSVLELGLALLSAMLWSKECAMTSLECDFPGL